MLAVNNKHVLHIYFWKQKPMLNSEDVRDEAAHNASVDAFLMIDSLIDG
jgi:hypothetical protein